MRGIDQKLYEQFLDFVNGRASNDAVPVVGIWDFDILRANGSLEHKRITNTLTSEGLNKLAQLGITNGTNSAFLYLAIGTQTAASSLGSTQAGLGEISRKLAATATTSVEFMILVMTWAGAADSITSLDLRTAGACNHASSGSGQFLNFVNSVATVLAASDFLKITMAVRIGSHNL